MAGAGGYDYEFVTAPPDRLVCKICHNPCRDAHLTNCCGAHYCRTCLQQVKKGRSVNRSCPMCRTEGFNTFPNKEADREIKALHVHCSNTRNGCTWSGEVNGIKKHIDSDCQFVDMPCPSKCGVILKRQCVQSHLIRDCPRRCQYCGYTGSKMEIAARHKKNCAQYPLPCPNGCELGVIPSAGMASHKRVCPLEIIACEYHGIGCNMRLPRKDVEKHNTEDMPHHLKLMSQALMTMNQDLSQQATSVQNVQRKLGDNKSTVSNDKFHIISQKMDAVNFEQTQQKENLEVLQKQFSRSIELIVINLFTQVWILLAVIAVLLIYAVYANIMSMESDNTLWRMLLQGSHLNTSMNDISPVILKMSNFTSIKKVKESWYSDLFFAFEGGHQMRLKVNAFGDGYHIIVALQLMKGPHDDELQRNGHFPLKLLATVELLNQSRNHNHHLVPIMLDSFSCGDCAQRVKENPYPRGFTISLISHSAVIKKHSYYLYNDQLIFRVSIMDRTSFTTGLYYFYSFMAYTNWRSDLPRVTSLLLFLLSLLILSWRKRCDTGWLHGHQHGVYENSILDLNYFYVIFDRYTNYSIMVVILLCGICSVILASNA